LAENTTEVGTTRAVPEQTAAAVLDTGI
jgi:hypothetical protein